MPYDKQPDINGVWDNVSLQNLDSGDLLKTGFLEHGKNLW